jgi:hypothetical protein
MLAPLRVTLGEAIVSLASPLLIPVKGNDRAGVKRTEARDDCPGLGFGASFQGTTGTEMRPPGSFVSVLASNVSDV